MVSDGIHYGTARQEKKDGVIVALTFFVIPHRVAVTLPV